MRPSEPEDRRRSTRSWVSRSEAETEALGATLARELAPDGILLVCGDLGAGKTVLTRGIAAGLGLDPSEVQSPTYTLVREHGPAGPASTETLGKAPGTGCGSRLVHLDLYRLESAETEALGLDEIFAGPGVKVVEWAERLSYDPPGGRWMRIRRQPDGERLFEEQSLRPVPDPVAPGTPGPEAGEAPEEKRQLGMKAL